MIGRLMKSVISCFDTHDKIDEVEKFAMANPIDSAKRAVEQGLKKKSMKFIFNLHTFGI